MPSTLRLPVTLGDADKLVITGDLSAAITALEEVKAEKKEVTKGFNERIKEHETTIHTLNVSLITGSIEREVEVEDVEDLFAGKVRTIRKDTGEVVKERAIDPEERQLKLGDTVLEGGGAIDLASERRKRDLTEEQEIAEDPEHAEEIRARRLAEEAADREVTLPMVGDMVEVKVAGATEWALVEVLLVSEFNFTADVDNGEYLFDVSAHGKSWRHKATWNDVHAASEKARQDEIERLEAEQKADAGPKKLLQNPRKKKANGAPKRVTVTDEKENILAKGGEDEAADPETPCYEDCDLPPPHVHSTERVAF